MLRNNWTIWLDRFERQRAHDLCRRLLTCVFVYDLRGKKSCQLCYYSWFKHSHWPCIWASLAAIMRGLMGASQQLFRFLPLSRLFNTQRFWLCTDLAIYRLQLLMIFMNISRLVAGIYSTSSLLRCALTSGVCSVVWVGFLIANTTDQLNTAGFENNESISSSRQANRSVQWGALEAMDTNLWEVCRKSTFVSLLFLVIVYWGWWIALECS